MTPKILNVYWMEYERKRQKEADMMDYLAWLNGIYMKSAIGVFVNKQNEYPENPLHKLKKMEDLKNQNPTKAEAMDFANYAAAFNLAMKGR